MWFPPMGPMGRLLLWKKGERWGKSCEVALLRGSSSPSLAQRHHASVALSSTTCSTSNDMMFIDDGSGSRERTVLHVVGVE